MQQRQEQGLYTDYTENEWMGHKFKKYYQSSYQCILHTNSQGRRAMYNSSIAIYIREHSCYRLPFK